MQVRDATLADAPAIGEAHAEALLVGFAVTIGSSVASVFGVIWLLCVAL